MSDGDDLANSDDAFDFADEQDLIAAILSLDIRNQRKQIRQQLTDPYACMLSLLVAGKRCLSICHQIQPLAVYRSGCKLCQDCVSKLS